MRHMRDQVVWQNFFGARLVELQMAEDLATGELEGAKAVAYLGKDSAKSVTEGKANQANDPLVQRRRIELHTAKAQRKAMEMAFNSRERTASLLSRELSRRTSGDPNQRRVDRYGGA